MIYGGEHMKRRNLRTNLSSNNVSRIGVLYETRRAAQVAREMNQFQLDTMGLSEVRWTTAGKVILSSGHTLLLSGPPNEEDHHRNGVGLLFTKQARKWFLE